MDVVIPSHNIRTFSASVACLTKIGKELYVDFDPLDGLTLRTLNDAKSAYGSFRFVPSFFERCAAPPRVDAATAAGAAGRNRGARSGGGRKRSRSRGGGGGRNDRRRGDDGSDSSDDEDDDIGRYVCRVPLRTVHAVLRPRKGVVSLRIRSSGAAVGSSLTQQSQTQSQSQQSRAATVTPDGGGAPRAGAGRGGGMGGVGESGSGLRMQLSFEFQTEHPKTGGSMRIVHSVSVSDADGVAAVASKDGCSEIVSSPATVLRLLEPLKRTAEVALTVDDVGKVVTATSFHHGDAVVGATSSGDAAADNALLNAAAASVLKTETSIGVDEFEDYSFRDDREDDDDASADEDRDGADGESGGGGNPPPPGVNEEVTLVFGIKEARAMLQFAHQAAAAAGGGSAEYGDDDGATMDAVISFHWGGRPITVEAEGETFRSQLILATLDHRLLGRGVRGRGRAGNSNNSKAGG